MVGVEETDILQEHAARSGWLSGNMAQLIVLLTGLVLAVTSYAILNVLIQQMLKDDMDRQVVTTQQTIGKNLGRLGQTINTAAIILSLSTEKPEKKLKEYMVSSVAGLMDFDRVFWLKPSGTSDGKPVNILTQDSDSFSAGSLKSLEHTILARKAEGGSGVIVITNPPGTQYWQEFTEPVIKGQPFVLAKAMEVNGKDIGIVVGLSRISRILDKNWLQDRTSVSRLVIRDALSKQRIYYMNRDFSADENIDFGGSGSNIQFNMGDDQWELNVLLGKNKQAGFLENTPWLMLIFGITLTLIGTLYVRNNQRQANKLAVMNRQLAQKNYELNSEVSERERLNQVVRKAEREYRAIIDSVSDIIFETSINGELVFLNDTWQKITGFELDHVMGRNLFDLLHPQDQEEQRTSFEQLVKGKKSAYRTFTRLRTSDGTFRSVELAVSMLRQDENRNMRVVGTFTDVEERRRAEKALSEAEKKYRTIVENAAGGIYQVTPEGQFLSANPAMARILGYETPEHMLREVKNAHDHLYAHPRDRTVFIRELETSGVINNFETEVRMKDGSRIWVNENARAVKDDDGNILYYEGSMENITSRKHAEIDLREAKIESDLANRAKSEFLANMSHELRTPLNSIIGFSEIIKNEVLGPLENKQYWEYANDIHHSGERLLTIINEILDVSRIETGNRQLNESVINMNEIISSCVEFMSQKAEDGELKITDMTQNTVPEVIGEEVAVKQIIINLLGNAIKFTPEGGRVTISHELERDGRLRIAVTDTGIGMEEHEIEKAFSPFGQLETAFSRSASGAGLGLTLARSLMKLHNGELDIFSQKGIGTTATIIFPAKRVAVEAEDGAATGSDTEQSDMRTGYDRREEAERRQGDRRSGHMDRRENDDRRDGDRRDASSDKTQGTKQGESDSSNQQFH